MPTPIPGAYTNSAQQSAYADNFTQIVQSNPGISQADAHAQAKLQTQDQFKLEQGQNLGFEKKYEVVGDPDVPSGILRYPYEALTETTDYLRIIIKERKNTGIIEGINADKATGFKGNLGGSAAINGNKIAVNNPTMLKNGGVILLPIPSNVTDSNSVSYNGGSMNSITAATLSGSLQAMQGGISSLNPRETKAIFEGAVGRAGLGLGSAKRLIQQQLAVSAAGIFGSNVSLDQLLARSEGRIFNPNMELLFDGVKLRSFNFQFKMTPRDANEAKQVKFIIKSLKRNMAPKTVDQGNLFLKTPNVFELSYMQGNNQHPFLNRFKVCALTDMKVNYTAENVYAVYDDSTPISMILDLSFQELVPVYAEDYSNTPKGVGY